ncbi:alkylated DNA repair protein [Pseudoroseomonas deserti]|uniref:Alkylated DNA repair protein n=1 Tax=Teichococcus deserti TaxID=1817963 RepID=A0A1V2H362_9PROT|nr:cytochrome c [Pseudoroseomonas deserti]ONG53552.1 alkylated DNA repair protein [Pseudoroseomonas deserti]
MTRRRLLGLLGAAGLTMAGLAWQTSAPRPGFGEDAVTRFEGGDATRGARVFAAGDCGSCHAGPGQADRLRLGGGRVLAAPFGRFHVPNISPHPRDGIGAWRGVDLANALLSGVSPQGAHYYPAFPYVAYARMTPEDVADLFAYLRSLPPVEGRPPPHELPFPLTIRRSLGLWKFLFLDTTPFEPVAGRDAEWHRGRYLVEAVAHCAECHSSRNAAGAIRGATRHAGGPDPEGMGFAPNITPTGLQGWGETDLTRLLATGERPDGRRVGAGMADVVFNTAQLPEADRRAMARYILSLPPRPTPQP